MNISLLIRNTELFLHSYTRPLARFVKVRIYIVRVALTFLQPQWNSHNLRTRESINTLCVLCFSAAQEKSYTIVHNEFTQ